MGIFPRYQGPSLLEQMCSVENLTLAWRQVRSNIEFRRRARSAGPDLVTIRDFEADWTHQMSQLAEELRSSTYRPLSPNWAQIRKKDQGMRAIAILAVRDRIAQRAMLQVLEPLFEPFFLDCSYGCRPLVGVPGAIARVERYAAQGLTMVVDADIQRYFDQIDQRILLSLIRQRVEERAVLTLIAQWLEAGTLTTPGVDGEPGADLLARGRQALRRVFDGATVSPPFPSVDQHDPYSAAAWEASQMERRMGVGSWGTPALGLDQRVWTALSLAQPVMEGTRKALPLVRKLGAHPAVLTGLAAAGMAAAGSTAWQRWRAGGPRGTPQGGPLSPLLANIYLHPFDRVLVSQGFRLVRYMDDFVVMCADAAEAEAALRAAERELASLRLVLHPDKTRVIAYGDGLEFLGASLAPRNGRRLGQGLTSFREAEDALREVARRVRRKK